MRWAKHVAAVGGEETHTGLRCGNLKEGHHFEYLDVGEGSNIKMDLYKKLYGKQGLDRSGPG
jgi:hypothetical protein